MGLSLHGKYMRGSGCITGRAAFYRPFLVDAEVMSVFPYFVVSFQDFDVKAFET